VRLLSPEALVALAAVPLIVLAWWRGRSRGGAIHLPSIGTASVSRPTLRTRLYPLLLGLRCLAIVAVALALARPQSLGRPVVSATDSVDVFVVLDVSSSMASEDFQPDNRLSVAKRVIADFVDARPADRIGLVAFARFSVLKCPLTTDRDVLKRQLSEAEMATGDDDGTAIGMALASAVNHLRRSPARNRVVVLLTDGENNRSTIDPSTGAELARALDVKVYTVGVGREMPADAASGGQPRAAFNEDALEAIAGATGGRYFRAADPGSLEAIFETVDALERSPVPSTVYRDVGELFAFPLAIGLLLAAAELLLRHSLLRRLP
jgi:Ca-activated chloride channel family protein